MTKKIGIEDLVTGRFEEDTLRGINANQVAAVDRWMHSLHAGGTRSYSRLTEALSIFEEEPRCEANLTIL